MNGKFFVFDGMDGAGKSTAVQALAQQLTQRGHRVCLTREPGGSPLAEEIRACMLKDRETAMSMETEVLLVFAARAAHMRDTILPALARGELVLCDRFTDSSLVYQGALGGADVNWLQDLIRRTVPRPPDQTFILDLPVETAVARMQGRGMENRFDRAGRSQLEKIRQHFLIRAQSSARLYQLLDAAQSPEQLVSQLVQAIDRALKA